jgi:uncharacterized DUF497 family protein
MMGGGGGAGPKGYVVKVKKPNPEFEYDENKSKSNKEKHGIDFKEAQNLWKDLMGSISRSKYANEERTILVAQYGGKHYTAIYTVRGDKIRIISVRRSRDNEVAQYEQRKQDD